MEKVSGGGGGYGKGGGGGWWTMKIFVGVLWIFLAQHNNHGYYLFN